jgi:hypothetical protein
MSGTEAQMQSGGGFRPILAALRAFVRELEPGAYASSDIPVVLGQLAEAEKLCGNAKILLARRADEGGAQSLDGEADATQTISRRLGEPAGKSRRDLETARRLAEQPEVEDAVRNGRISSSQAALILQAAGADPEATGQLLQTAENASFAELKGECQSVVAAAMNEKEANDRDAAIRARRHLHIGATQDGAVYFRGELPAVEGALVRNAIEREARLVFREARREGRREAHEAYLADAFVRLVHDGANAGVVPGEGCVHAAPPGSGSDRKLRHVPRAEIVLHVSAEALRRGELEPGEFCEIPGVGPVPLSTVEYLFGSALGKLVVRDGVDILAVTHFGHFIPAHLDTAVRARDRFCVVPGCGVDYRLERDHVIPVEEGGPTELANLVMLCGRHHYLKTHKFWRLRGGPGHWEWFKERPDQPIARDDDPCEPAAPGEPTIGLARPLLTPLERTEAFASLWDGDNPEDDPPEEDPPDEPGASATYRQQTFACSGRSAALRLAC